MLFSVAWYFLFGGPGKLYFYSFSILAMIRRTKEQNNWRVLLELFGGRLDPHRILSHKRKSVVSYIASKEWHRTYLWALRRENKINLWISLVNGLWYKHQFIQLETLLSQLWGEATKGEVGAWLLSPMFLFLYSTCMSLKNKVGHSDLSLPVWFQPRTLPNIDTGSSVIFRSNLYLASLFLIPSLIYSLGSERR